MNLSVGIVGLPNVGKSTLFNALLKKQQALVANYPFTTVEPNVGIVPLTDKRLDAVAEAVEKETGKKLPKIYATVTFVDIAGLVKGAAEGAGLGNKFLSHIREVALIAHVIRAFTDDNIIREGSSDPESDYATAQTELILSDLQSAVSHEAKNKNYGEKVLLKRIIENLNSGIPLRQMKFTDEEKDIVRQLFFLTSKPEIIVLNVSEDDESLIQNEVMRERYANLLQISQENVVVICAKIESELTALSSEEQKQYLRELGLAQSGLDKLIQKSYEMLGLISFFTTTGLKEVRAWTIRKGEIALAAAGEIHSDFEKKFVKAEVISFEDFVKYSGWKASREKGKTRMEGRDYIVRDGDVIEFKIGS